MFTTLLPIQRIEHEIEYNLCPVHGYEAVCDCGWGMSSLDRNQAVRAVAMHLTAETN